MLFAKIEERIEQYRAFLDELAYEPVLSLALEAAHTKEIFRKPPDGLDYTEITLPYAYGEEWTTYWFRSKVSMKKAREVRELFLHLRTNADSLVFLNGRPFAALNPFHEKVRIPDWARAGSTLRFDIEAYAGHRYPGEHPLLPDRVILTLDHQVADYPILLDGGRLVTKNPVVYHLSYDVRVLFGLARELPEDSLRRNRLLKGLYDALMEIHFTSRGEQLEAECARASAAIAPLLQARNSVTTPTIDLVGHAHIDHAWLWPLWETERKVARTFANMATLAEEFDEFVFMQSQPAQLAILEREYPEIFERVRAAFERGQWEPNGGMWIEADCNLSGGESLIRQFLVGKAATREMLGYEGDTLWLPDVFGYAACLPQILAGCEIDYFVTSKINWNDTTRFPYDTFVWYGIDGTGVATHFITSRVNGYNGRVDPHSLNDAWKNVQHKEIQDRLIKPIGEGDGGGGTMRADLEQARRLQDLEGAPRTRWSKISESLGKIFARREELPEWRGELYLELHRGTYTTQARTKRHNRKLELALRDAEFLSVAACRLLPGPPVAQGEGRAGAAYPAEQLLQAWKLLLTNQFHDIIPGSSITAVYRDSESSYAAVGAAVNEIVSEALAKIGSGTPLTHASLLTDYLPAEGGGATDMDAWPERLVVWNTLSWERRDVVRFKAPEDAKDVPVELLADGRTVPSQLGPSLDGEEMIHAMVAVPSMGWSALSVRESSAPTTAVEPISVQGRSIETPYYAVEFDDSMRMVSMVERETGRELVADGAGFNVLGLFEDVPVRWDAWDIDADYELKRLDEIILESSEIVSHGPLFLQLRNRYRVGSRSSLVQDLFFYAHSRRVDFETQVDWREDHRMLKAAFETGMHAQSVRCEVQYGNVLRPNHANRPADRAQFEFCAHKWVAVGDSTGGVALLNDCKYGYDSSGGTMRITLLRSPKAPDPDADMGTHRFTYSILPYHGRFSVAEVVRPAYELNSPAIVAQGGEQFPKSGSLFSVDNPNIILEAVKQSEDGRGIIVRLYEASGGAGAAILSTGFEIGEVFETNMLERSESALEHGPQRVRLRFRAFEIKTLKIVQTANAPHLR